MRENLRWASFISGGGTTMEAVGRASLLPEGELYGLVQPVVVISSREGVDGIRKAEQLGIPTEILCRKDYPKGIDGVNPYGRALKTVLNRYQPDVVTLNGFLAMISDDVIEAYDKRIFNQHPGPPEFGGVGMHGKAVHEAVILFGKRTYRTSYQTEVIAQRVSPDEYDRGAVVKHEYVSVDQQETAESLQQKALSVEHQLQIQLLKDATNGVVRQIAREPFVHPIDYEILYACMREAKENYPNG